MGTRIHPRIKNSGQDYPAIWYGRHLTPGVAEYADGPGGEPYRIFISPDTAKAMDPSFEGRPVYCNHVDDENVNAKNKTVEGITKDDKGNLETKIADGYVIESFYLPVDGAHWIKFIVTSKEGADAIRRKWALSNCYQPLAMGSSGEWHGVQYSKEFTSAEYKHCALVQHPRYRESIILSPADFKIYCEEKTNELAAMRNSADVIVKSKPEEKPMSLLNKLFARKAKVEKVENADEIGKITVAIGKNKTTTIAALVKNAEAMGDKDFEKLNDGFDPEDLEKNDDDADLTEEEKAAKNKKNRKKSGAEDPEKEKENDESDDEKMAALRDKKKSDASDKEEEKENDDEEEKAEEKKNKGKKNGDKNSPADADKANDDADEEKDEKKNDDLGSDPLKHVVMLDDEETTVGDMINDFTDLKNRHNALRKKHDALKQSYGEMCNKYGDDDALENDDEIPAEDKEVQEVLGKLEQEEDNLTESLERRKNQIMKVIGKMKNSKELKEKRAQKAEEGRMHFERLKNAEYEKMLNENIPTVGTSTATTGIERGKARYGSSN